MTYFLKLLGRVILLSSIFSFLPPGSSHAESGAFSNLKGPGFGNPSAIFEMSDEWVKQSIRYSPEHEGADIVITSDPHLYDAWAPLIEKYASANGLNIIITRGTCGVTAGRLTKKTIDSGIMCCPPADTDRVPGLKFHTVGIAAIALIVNPANPVNSLTEDEARQIFSGKVRKWSQVSTESNFDTAAQPIARLHCKLRPGHWRLLLDNEDLFSPSVIEVSVIPDTYVHIDSNPGAIGFDILWMTHVHRDKGKVKTLAVNGYSPENEDHMLSGNYPFYRTYSFTTWEGSDVENPHVPKLIEYISGQVDKLDSKFGIVPAKRLKEAGWKFNGNELVGEPDKK